MSRFAHVLKNIGDRLEIHEPAKTRVLLEIAADLEDLYQHHRARGCDEDEAARRAEEAFATSDEALHLLARVHEGGSGSAAEGLSHQIGSLWSKFLLAALLVFEVLLAARIFTERSFFVHPSPFLWPVAGIAAAAFAFTVWKLAQISRAGTDIRRLRNGLNVPLVFAGASLATAGLGFLFHLQRFFRLNAAGAPDALFRDFAGWMISISSLMTVALLTAIFAGLVWFVLSGLVSRSEMREVESLVRTAS